MPIENCVTSPTVPVVDGVGIAVDDGTGCPKTLLGPGGYYLRVNAAGDGLEWVQAHEPAHLETGLEPFQWDDAQQCGVIPLPGTLVDNGDGSFTFTPGDGADPTTVAWTVTNNDAPFAWDPATWTLNIPQAGTVVDNGNGTLTFNPGNGDPLVVFKQGWTEISTTGSVVTFTYPDGSEQVIDLCALVAASCADSLVDNGDGTLTHTAIDGTQMTFLAGGLTVATVGSVVTFTLPDGTAFDVDVCGLIAANCADVLVDNGDGTFTHVSVGGASVTIDMRRATFVDNGDGTFNLTDDFGNTVTVGGSDVVTTMTNIIVGNRIATYTNEAGAVVDINETVTGLVDNGNGTLTYTNEAGVSNMVQPGWTTVALAGSTLTFSYPDGTTVDLALPSGATSMMTQGADTAAGSQTVVHDDGNGNTFTFCEGFNEIAQTDQCFVAPNPDRQIMERVVFTGKTFNEVRVPDHYSTCVQPELGERLFFKDPNSSLLPPFVDLTWIDNGLTVLDQVDGAFVITNPSACRSAIVDFDVYTRLRLDPYFPHIDDGVLWLFAVQFNVNGGGWETVWDNAWFAGPIDGATSYLVGWGLTPRPMCQFLTPGATMTIDHRLVLVLGDAGAPDPTNIGLRSLIYNQPTLRISIRTT